MAVALFAVSFCIGFAAATASNRKLVRNACETVVNMTPDELMRAAR